MSYLLSDYQIYLYIVRRLMS